MALPILNVTPGSGATINTLPNAPAVIADSISVALATDTVLPLPTGAAADGTDATGVVQLAGGIGIRGWLSGIFSKVSTAANQATQITSLAAILAAIQATDTAIAITNRSGYINGAVSAAAVQSIGTQGWAPGDTLTMPSGAGVGAPAVLNVQSTQLAAVPTIAAAGSGGTNGAVTLTGTTGTGTKFTLAGTISGGVLTAIGSISVAGNYTVNPTNLAAEPVTGGGLTGATVNIKMAILALGVTTPGVYTAPVTNPLAPAATSGSGVGATVNLTSFTPLSTQVAALNASRQYLAIRNESTAQNIGFSLSGAAAFGAVGTSTLLSNFNGYDWSGNRVPSNALTAIGQVAFQQFTAWEG
ncbi:hypothetical protein [Methylocella tundrae]|uniref:Uncharacterized protein n=1 Tax=Methylocella tundrae TaxID=227605 RepID=A0A4U8YX04_METTU|nr:hypothetical protein [Methylocella tundrae]WPP05527.1 hypothetical protein SIN04_06795 [Methylocella tundrae]VFU07955.1 conserved protein of unknown function [Methylocella tundrae]